MKFVHLAIMIVTLTFVLIGCASNAINVTTDIVTQEFFGFSQYAWHADFFVNYELTSDGRLSVKEMNDYSGYGDGFV